jgi:hypothetical protein
LIKNIQWEYIVIEVEIGALVVGHRVLMASSISGCAQFLCYVI